MFQGQVQGIEINIIPRVFDKKDPVSDRFPGVLIRMQQAGEDPNV